MKDEQKSQTINMIGQLNPHFFTIVALTWLGIKLTNLSTDCNKKYDWTF